MLLFVLKSQRPIMYERYDRQTSQVCGMDVLIYYSIKVCHYQSIKNAISFLYRARKNKPNISLNSVSSVLSISLLKSTLERSKLFLHIYLFSIKPIHPIHTQLFNRMLLKQPDVFVIITRCGNILIVKTPTRLTKILYQKDWELTACNDIML